MNASDRAAQRFVDSSASAGAAGPTRVRYLVVGLCMAMSVLLYLDRFALTPITSTILLELGFNEEEFGRAVGAFFLVYALCQVPAGWLSDWFGARWTLALYVVGWSLATLGLGLASGLAAVAAMRMALGATQAGAYPAAASLLKRWIPLAGRGRANSLVSMGGRTGYLLALFATPTLTMLAAQALGWQAGGWRVVLGVYGCLGIVWSGLFVLLYRDSPHSHPWCNAAERAGMSHEVATARPTASEYGRFLQALVRSPEMGLMCVINVSVNVGWVFLVTWLPRYLTVRHGTELSGYFRSPEVLAGLLTALPALAAMLGGISGGTATDHFVRRYGRTWGRRLPGLLAGTAVAVLYVVATQCSGLWTFLAVMIVISFTIDFGLGASWASFQDIGGRQVAMVLGVGNMCGNLGAAFFGWQIGALAKGGWWHAVFVIAALAMALNATCWLLFDASRPILREEPR